MAEVFHGDVYSLLPIVVVLFVVVVAANESQKSAK
jgi:hypothetical protein